ncbi:HEAT repeat domain-containing protein [Neobacillus sp. DY30]|uniref:HEAT repeat domain-containing protein n=1 Tax=Neobacillus sp. DY30 TaxID=3047871 RepID=UPI0024BFE291|nr:HEAT repeat domain-containing protein [Neobacillus sp. DY30]WHY01924.1 HEAT repeat domain-containing protein [Neobacillus sp. DY30]
MINQEIMFLSIITLSLTCILSLLLLYLIIRKVRDIKKRREIEDYKNKVNTQIFSIIAEGQSFRGIRCETAIQQKAMEELLSKYVKILEGKEEKERLSNLASLSLEGYYRKRLKSKRWSHRMNALYHIEDFHMTNLKNEVVLLSKKKNITHQETIHILRILASFQFSGLKDMLPKHYNDLSEYEYRSILMKLTHSLFDQFVLDFHKSTPALQYAILDVISLKKALEYRSFTENIFISYKGEVRLRALKALAELGFVSNIEPYLQLLHSASWQERMVAAKLIGSIKAEKGIPRLIELLHDQNWWVRSQAGQSISQFPDGKAILQSVLETSEDAFARDMAWDWLHKGV